jgi:urease accessory protein
MARADRSATLLRLMRLASPSLPVGGFSYSEGLEAAVECGAVRDEPTAGRWLDDQLWLQLARADLVVLAQAADAWRRRRRQRIARLNAWVQQTRESAELRLQAEQTGRSMLAWLQSAAAAAGDARVRWLAALDGAPTWPVAFALASTLAGASTRGAALAFAMAWAENMTQAAVRAVPLGQVAAQRLLDALCAAIPAAADQALRRGEPIAFAPRLAVLSAQHEAQYSRLFRS